MPKKEIKSYDFLSSEETYLLHAAATYVKNDGLEQQFQEIIEDMQPDKSKDAIAIAGELVICRIYSIITHSNKLKVIFRYHLQQ
jgi:hypothetical protein